MEVVLSVATHPVAVHLAFESKGLGYLEEKVCQFGEKAVFKDTGQVSVLIRAKSQAGSFITQRAFSVG
jgi:hypothetical protein